MRREEQEEKIASLLGGLGRVDAPHGFESRVMRRIAEGEPAAETRRPVLLLVLKFAAPAAMLVLMAMLFVFFGDREVSNALVPPVQESNTPVAPTAAEAPATIDSTLASTSPVVPRPTAQPPVNSAALPQPASPPRVMSEDFAVQGPGETITPPGLDPRPRNIDPSSAMPKANGVPVSEVLSFLGVNASCGDEGCRVTSVSAGSFAQRTGLAAGDRIVSIDGRSVNASARFTGTTSFKTFQVNRGGRTLNLSLTGN